MTLPDVVSEFFFLCDQPTPSPHDAKLVAAAKRAAPEIKAMLEALIMESRGRKRVRKEGESPCD